MKSIELAPLTTGTTSDRVPSPLSTSTARPRLTVSLTTRRGLPSSPVVKLLRIAGTASVIARTMAYPMKWVKLTLPNPERLR